MHTLLFVDILVKKEVIVCSTINIDVDIVVLLIWFL